MMQVALSCAECLIKRIKNPMGGLPANSERLQGAVGIDIFRNEPRPVRCVGILDIHPSHSGPLRQTRLPGEVDILLPQLRDFVKVER